MTITVSPSIDRVTRVRAGEVTRFSVRVGNSLFCEGTADNVRVCTQARPRAEKHLRLPPCAQLGQIELSASRETPFKVKARKRAHGRYLVRFVLSYVAKEGAADRSMPAKLRIKRARKR